MFWDPSAAVLLYPDLAGGTGAGRQESLWGFCADSFLLTTPRTLYRNAIRELNIFKNFNNKTSSLRIRKTPPK